MYTSCYKINRIVNNAIFISYIFKTSDLHVDTSFSIQAGLDNKHLKSLAIRAGDCQDLLAQLQRVLAQSKVERS